MQQYIVSDVAPTGPMGKFSCARQGTGLTGKIVVSGLLGMLMLVATPLAASWYTVSSHVRSS